MDVRKNGWRIDVDGIKMDGSCTILAHLEWIQDWVDGCMDVWTGWMGGWMYVCMCVSLCVLISHGVWCLILFLPFFFSSSSSPPDWIFFLNGFFFKINLINLF